MSFVKIASFIFALLCCGLPFGLSAQTLITKNFNFADGVYLTLESLQRNAPDYEWADLTANLAVNPQTYLTQVEYIAVKDTNDTLTGVYALTLGGIPYLRLSPEEGGKELTVFAGLRVRGRYCYYTFENTYVKKIPVSAYNPRNGRPFRTAVVEREETRILHRLLDFTTGKITEFNRDNFLQLIRDDRELTRAVRALQEEEVAEKLFKSLLIYDDRHPIYVKE